ncbi:type II secretion system protein GspM [Lamprobacter modestohalophilus]|uniref:type II secretion system protein GspM n=1 Tax=Lamprobacter modestohalophilus TaxID=1064514 RepID=UPI002ADEDCD3|nr:type II secretion system protein GspM [Lamprobacter modestohalophilus]MEA1051510.1 type II secretion system protein GspM [Lamprobacter modestohalophilus]
MATSKQKTCALFWLLTGILPLVILGAIFVSWSGHLGQLSERIANHRDQIRGIQSGVAVIPALQAALQAERSRDDLNQYAFQGETWSLAAALAQGNLNALLSDADLMVASVQALPQRASEAPDRISIRAQAQGTTEQLADLLYRIESATPFLIVEDLSVRPLPQPARRRPGPAEVTNAPGLVIQLQVYGIVLRS